MKFLSSFPFHTFLLAAATVLSSIVQVKQEVLPEEMVPPLVLMEIYALVVFLLAWALFRNSKKGGVAASFIVGLTLCFEQFRKLLTQVSEPIFHAAPSELVVLLVFLTVVGLALKLIFLKPPGADKEEVELKVTAQFDRMHIAFNIMCVILLALNVVPLVISEIEQGDVQAKMVAAFREPFKDLKLKGTTRPDVYYIILDAFAGHDTLKEAGYDNSAFIQYLKDKGFNVVDQAASNYDRTPFSISSSLNMQYIERVPEKLGVNYVADNVYYRLIQNSAVASLFKSLGYKYINISSGSFATDFVPQADENLRVDFGNHFTTSMMMLTPLLATEKYLPLMRDAYCERRLAPGRLLPDVIKMTGPKFVLVHTDLPHPPSLFDEQGNKLDLPRELLNDHSTDMKSYIAQLKYCESEVKKWIEMLLAQKNKPVIILQSDHGLYYPRPTSKEYYNEVMRIFNAYYLPDYATDSDTNTATDKSAIAKDAAIYEGITPVNSFRIVFNKYFQAALPLLDDKSWCSADRMNPYKWTDVRPLLDFSQPAKREAAKSK
jgi:hypothetical protein